MRINIKSELVLFYLLWPIIISPKEVQFILIGSMLIYLLSKSKLRFDSISYFLIFFLIIYLFSIVYNLINYSFEMERILATINTFSIWLIALFYYLLYKDNEVSIQTLKKIVFVNYSILIIIWCFSKVYYVLTGEKNVNLIGNVLYYSEWFNQTEVVRFGGLMEYPNLIIMFFMFFYPLYCMHIISFKNNFVRVVLIGIGLLPIITTYSRSGYVVIAIGLLVYSLMFLYKNLNIRMFVFLFCIVGSLLTFTLAYTDVLENLFEVQDKLLNAREGSNDSRTFLMKESIRMALENSPLIGMGIKDRSIIGYPLGSHSTFVGFIYKTGFVGFIVGTLIFLVISLKMLLLKAPMKQMLLYVFILVFPLILVFEDLDGANWLIVFYFIFVGLFFNKKFVLNK